jgi:Mg-chelatase subunit ChlD
MINHEERTRRWRLVLGSEADSCCRLGGGDIGIDAALEALYGEQGGSGLSNRGNGRPNRSKDRQGGTGASMPNVARWLGDIRSYFPSSVVQVMQRDAIERLNMRQLLLEPEMLRSMQPDVHLVADLLSLNNVMPAKTRETAREVIGEVVRELQRKLTNPMRQAVMGSLNRSVRNYRPRHHEIDWKRTIQANLKHYLPEYRTIIPNRLIGYGRKRSSLREVILCVDQSGSMATSVVYAGIFGAVMASLPALKTQVVVFDTAIVDLTAELHDPVELLFGTQLGGGTDINGALAYCQSLIRRPQETILLLISDLYEGGNAAEMLKRVNTLASSGVQMIALLALNDEGAPSFDHRHAEQFAALGVPAFACTPDLFPDLMAAAINRTDLNRWAAKHNITTSGRG